jgi:hypothetical protein
MAQLEWVTDCRFAYRKPSEAADPTYELLRTSIGDGVVERLEVEKQAASHAREEAAAAKRRLVADRLEDYRAALSLSPKEAVARYSGRDDMLLLCLIEPSYRATTQLVCSLSPDDLATLFGGDVICRAWEDWTAEQRDFLTKALGFEESWLDKGPLKIWIAGPDHGYLQIHPWIETTDEFPGPRGGTFRRTALTSGEEMNATEIISLGRALGEEMDADEAYKKTVELAQDLSRRQSRKRQEDYAATLRTWPSLSPACRDKLAAIRLLWHSRCDYPVWEVQEAVAAASGMNVVSDCFVWPQSMPRNSLALLDGDFRARSLARAEEVNAWVADHEAELEAMDKRGEPAYTHPALQALSTYSLSVSALAWLTALCHPEVERASMLESYQNDYSGFEWGDAGAFLHFRSVNRDVWRASMLPQDIVDYIDAKTEDTVTSLPTDEKTRGWVKPAWTVEDRVHLAGQLTDLQARFGGQQVYEDPAEPEAAARNYLRRGLVWDAVSESLRFLAALTESQWQALLTGGLRWADLTRDQQHAPFALTAARRSTEEFRRDAIPEEAAFVIRALRGDPDPARPERVPDIAVYFLELQWKDEVLFLDHFNARPVFSVSQMPSSIRSRPPLLPAPNTTSEPAQ